MAKGEAVTAPAGLVSDGLIYDCVRLELDDSTSVASAN
jgi:hypothetical protein